LLLSQFKIQFIDRLKDHFPAQEIQSFFNLITEDYLGMSRLEIALQPDKELTPQEVGVLNEMLLRLERHEPIQYILGKTEFFGLKFKVNLNVLIPRPETEDLVQWILTDNATKNSSLSILDIGTGSGCISISLAKNFPESKVSAIDISTEALKTARENAEINAVKVEFIEDDILNLESLDRKFDIIVSNPPYVRELEKKEMHRNVLENEPDLALYVKDHDPLIFYSKIADLAMNALSSGGALYFEINQYLGKETEDLLKERGFQTELRKDIFGNYRMLKGTKG
jgi:release factor glutamine methyltransferase